MGLRVSTAPRERTTQDVIDQAVRENRLGEWLCYGFATVLVGAGAFALVWGTVTAAWVPAASGTLMSGLFWPAMVFARQVREAKLMMRLLEIPLMNAKTSKDAADALRKAFERLFPGGTKQEE